MKLIASTVAAVNTGKEIARCEEIIRAKAAALLQPGPPGGPATVGGPDRPNSYS
jgi:hypothetical protein